MNLIMSEVDGFEALEKIRKDKDTKKLKVVAVTNLGQEDDKKRVKELGVEDYIVKASLSIDEFIEKLRNYLK